ncbi:hypothetical protein E3Z27_21370 [Pseudomonas mediterranea]|uniref:hypothetical protein n=1 Tax=Pseudomonas mediterranea TaxID=183795 RepID=UPI00052FA042|nr:hypothetical protein [Pseudomonas mediterranea]KGU85435.1 hypothetical protein N005_09870 [Pseudomonas mediterranea CFBP 5447]QHA84027.1 hypothetical protein E3Z27_21370 [Pseudomonas mediterranea]
MTKIILRRLRLKDQLSNDLLKIFALIERTIVASILILLVFIFMSRMSLMNGPLGWEVLSGLIGYLAIVIKKMYYDEALSELRMDVEVERDVLRCAMLSIGYSEKKVNVYWSKKIFSFFFYCKSEAITYTPQSGLVIFIGPYDKLLTLASICNQHS